MCEGKEGLALMNMSLEWFYIHFTYEKFAKHGENRNWA